MQPLISISRLVPRYWNNIPLNQCTRSYVIKRKYPPDPTIAAELPGLVRIVLNFPKLSQFAVDDFPVRDERKTSVHVWGRADHGALGAYIQKKSKMKNRNDKRFLKFNRPLRLTFAENHSVADAAAGYGFSIFVVRSHERDTVFGTGINTDSQIGNVFLFFRQVYFNCLQESTILVREHHLACYYRRFLSHCLRKKRLFSNF